MKVLIASIVGLLVVQTTWASDALESGLVEIAKVYKHYCASGDLDAYGINKLNSFQSTELEPLAQVVLEMCTDSNKILSREYLYRPNTELLQQFHALIVVYLNMFVLEPKDNLKLARSALRKKVTPYELLHDYYSSVFISVVNKNRPFDLSGLDINLDSLGLLNDKEKAMVFFAFVDGLGNQVDLYLTRKAGPNYTGIHDYVYLLPTINGQPYYKYQDFYFPDFKITMYREKQYVKAFYMKKFYRMLLGHYGMLVVMEKSWEEKDDLRLRSILLNDGFRQYCDQPRLLDEVYGVKR